MVERLSDIAKMIDHSLLNPVLSDDELTQGCELAKLYKVASVCIKPYAVKMASKILKGSEVAVGTVIGFPHGSCLTQIKTREAELACIDGATELDMVVNIGKVFSKDWSFVESDIKAVVDIVRKHSAIVKIIFENDFLVNDEFKIKLCEISERAKADFVKTSTGYGFVKRSDGNYSYKGATDYDLKLMRANCSSKIQIKAAGGVRTLDDLLRVRALGVTRIGTTATEAILNEAKQRFT